MDLEIVILSKVSQTEKEKYSDIPYMWNLKKKKMIQMNLLAKQKETHSLREQTSSCQESGGRLGGKDN